MPAAVPIATTLIGSAATSRGSKKAAKGAQARVPEEFRGPLGAVLNLINRGLPNEFGAAAPGVFAAPLQPIQTDALARLQAMFGPNLTAAQGGLDEALATIRAISASGLDPATIKFVSDQLAPFFGEQREQGVAGVREASAARGGFFGSGSQTAEADFLRRLSGEQQASVLPLALQSQALRLSAAQQIPGLITGTQESLINQLINAFQAGEVGRTALTHGLPIQAVNFLVSLMGGTPFHTPVVPTNFLQALGPQISSLGGSPGFQSLFGGKGGGGGGRAGSLPPFGTIPGTNVPVPGTSGD